MGSNRIAVACLVLGAFHSAMAAESSPDSLPLTLPFAQAGATADVAELQRAQTLLAQGQPAQAYELLSPREVDWAGIPLYDYLLGMAALDTGRSGEAIFSLQRVVANEPAFSGARMELARAHYEAGELKASRTQFQYLLTQSPPPAARSIIERYLSSIEGRGPGGGSVRPFIELGAGFDSNANGSTSEQSFLGFTLDENNVETDSPFFELAAGLNHGVAIGDGGSWSNGLRLSHRLNPDADFIDQSIASLGSALGWAGARGRATAGVSGYYSLLDGEDHEWGAALDLGTGRRLGDNWDIGLALRGGPVRYENEQLLILETDRYLGALTLTRLNIGGRAARMGVSILGGRDDERQGSPYGNERRGARLTAGWTISPRAGMYVEAGFLRTEYDDTPGFFGVDREDEETSGLIATEFQGWPGRGWTLSPRLRYVQHDSNVTLYEYDRWEASVYLRRSYR